MKTIVIWDQCGEEPVQFFTLDGDYSHLYGVYINNSDEDEQLVAELTELVYGDNGYNFPLTKDIPLKLMQDSDNKIIVAGFLP